MKVKRPRIITLDQINPYQGPKWEALKKRYDEDEEFRRKADRIHAHRMLPPPTCYECMEAASRTFEINGMPMVRFADSDAPPEQAQRLKPKNKKS